MASLSIMFLLISLSMQTFHTGETTQTKKFSSKEVVIRPGSSLSPLDNSSWSSPSGNFVFGFYQQKNDFAVGIWLVGSDGIWQAGKVKTVVWTANRDDPPVNYNAKLVFTTSGKLLLRTEKGEERPIANTENSAFSASMLDSGNFVLRNKTSDIIWQSFDHPTDTILQGQMLPTGGQLFSSVSETNHSTGRFYLAMQGDGSLALYPSDTGNTYAYWGATDSWQPQISHFNLFLNSTGRLSIIDDSHVESSSLNNESSLAKASQNSTIIYRATVHATGNFLLYSHEIYDKKNDEKEKHSDLVSVVWSALQNPCDVSGFCGPNSYCILHDAQPNCICVPGTDYADPDPDRRSVGCVRNSSKIECGPYGRENVAFYKVSQIDNMNWAGVSYAEIRMSNMENCSQSCLEDCNCEAAIFELNDIPDRNNINDGYDNYRGYVCRKQKLPLIHVKSGVGRPPHAAFFKVSKGSRDERSVRNKTFDQPPRSEQQTANKKLLTQILVIALGFIMLSCVSLVISGVYIVKIRVLRYKKLRDDGTLGNMAYHEEVTLRVFSYNELKRATNGFKEKLGKGSFGTVYKGSLSKGKKLVAVKRLEKLVEEGEREFRAEMRAIGRTNHKNLVRLLGYCAEGSKRLLVYEYMSNGSLADLLFTLAMRVDWNERVRIAIDVARGILYLHEECKVPIIHCDIKPQNILMDDFWTAKISDFGLAKFLMPDQTRTSTAVRGTRGYLAPEWQKNTPISVKADVYSYGVVLLEIVCCRRNLDANVSNPDEIVLSSWVYKCFAARELRKLVIGDEVDKKTFENMVKVGLWCIQDEPALRPSMKSVVLMLEGITDVSIPPCPTST